MSSCLLTNRSFIYPIPLGEEEGEVEEVENERGNSSWVIRCCRLVRFSFKFQREHDRFTGFQVLCLSLRYRLMSSCLYPCFLLASKCDYYW